MTPGLNPSLRSTFQPGLRLPGKNFQSVKRAENSHVIAFTQIFSGRTEMPIFLRQCCDLCSGKIVIHSLYRQVTVSARAEFLYII